MTSPAGLLRTFAFGDLATGVWGAALMIPGEPPFLCLGREGVAATAAATLEGAESEEQWRVAGEGIELALEPLGETVDAGGADSEIAGFDQLCQVSGSFTLDGAEQPVSALGCRGAREGSPDLMAFVSLREVLAWFGPSDGLALAAFRPRKSKGQETDVISAAVLDSESAAAVDDPRLSTTYTASGRPARASLELWLPGEDDQQLLRRAAGEATGGGVESVEGELEVRAELFHWYSHGHDGAGVYLLASRR